MLSIHLSLSFVYFLKISFITVTHYWYKLHTWIFQFIQLAAGSHTWYSAVYFHLKWKKRRNHNHFNIVIDEIKSLLQYEKLFVYTPWHMAIIRIEKVYSMWLYMIRYGARTLIAHKFTSAHTNRTYKCSHISKRKLAIRKLLWLSSGYTAIIAARRGSFLSYSMWTQESLSPKNSSFARSKLVLCK